jgi:nicotinamide riboside kinase
MAERTDTKIIVATGAESTGKTELCRFLAQTLVIPWVPELARGYVEQLGRPYSYDDVVEIARLQIAEFERAIAAVLTLD